MTADGPQMRRRYPVACSSAVVFGLAIFAAWIWHATEPLFEVAHAPQHFERRAGAFAANITGVLSWRTAELSYRLNSGPWHSTGHDLPRVPAPNFTVELLPAELRAGHNRLELLARAPLRLPQRVFLGFDYDPSAPVLPLSKDWSEAGALDVQDGQWETFAGASGKTWVRPVPGTEEWDRVVVVAGAFGEGRRVRTQVRMDSLPSTPGGWGFGIFSLWGGQPDNADRRPRRGWRFALSWYFSKVNAIGVGFSERLGDEAPRFVETYRDFALAVGEVYEIVVETWPERSRDGKLRRWRQRHKWWPAGAPEPAVWQYATDRWGAPLPDIDYGVALFSLRTQVAFGPVLVEGIAAPRS